MDWNELLAAFDRCVVSAAEAEVNEAPEATKGEAECDQKESDPNTHDQALSELNLKLIEMHSRLKSLAGGDLEEEEELTSPSHSGTDLADMNLNRQVTPSVAQELVLRCGIVLSQRGRHHSHSLAAQLLAELCRGDVGRNACLRDGSIVNKLEGALGEQGGLKQGSVETTVQMCRILGNLCFNCTEGRQQIMKTKCLEHIFEVANNTSRVRNDDPGQRFPVILPGFLLNFCNENPEAVNFTGRIGFVRVIVDNILATATNDAVFNSSLNFLVTVAEDASGHDYLKEASLFPTALNHILVHSTSPEVTETALELIRSIAEDPDLTLSLAKSDLCMTMISHIVGRWSSQEFETHRSDACDLLVLILSHDESMKYIYNREKGSFLETFLDWLRKGDTQLKVAASLAIGNFACSEEHCSQLMANGTSQILIDLLKKHLHHNADSMKLHHALLGSIRNLAVTPEARGQLLEEGLLEPCLFLMETLSVDIAQPVIFKLLATLRLVIDGSPEAARKIAQNQAYVSTLVSWGATDAQALNAETGRLLAALIKHCHSKEVMEIIVSTGGLPHVAAMLRSPHVRMLNEALISLTIMAATLESATVKQQLYTDLVINGIKDCVCAPCADQGSRRSSCPIPIEVKTNSLKFAQQLMRADQDQFKQMLRDLDFYDSLKNMTSDDQNTLKLEFPEFFPTSES